VPVGMGGNLGGIDGADAKCKELATQVSAALGAKTWVAWLSAEMGAGGMPVHAKDRIGSGPWHDARGRLVAMTLADLIPGPNMRPRGDMAAVNGLIDEKGVLVPQPNHDILTGTRADGTLAMGQTCGDWKSTQGTAMLGHSDNNGPANRRSWTEAHPSQGCTVQGVAAGGGNGRVYCFAKN
jgi:hypothetical protein